MVFTGWESSTVLGFWRAAMILPQHYVELRARSAFSFLRAASLPEQIAERAAQLNLPAVALCDRDGLYSAPRFFAAAKEHGIKPIIGAELTMEDASILPVLVESQKGYQNLCKLITRSKRRGSKTESSVKWVELSEFAEGLIALTGGEEGPLNRHLAKDDYGAVQDALHELLEAFGKDRVYVELQRHFNPGEFLTNQELIELARLYHLPLVATNGVLYATKDQRHVLDVFTCARNHTHLDAAGLLLSCNDEWYLKNAKAMALLFGDVPEAIENTVHLAERLTFSLENLGYEFPKYAVPEGESMNSFLRKVTMAGARARYPHLGKKVLNQLNHELGIIERLGFSGYFLTVWDVVNFCTEQNILVQGRGSAANSAVCYSLGITACDPISSKLLFERFLSEGRTSWPDIDLDLPSGERRERVIQEVYRRYGEHGAAMTANVITYRGKSAMREIGKALNFSPDVLSRFSNLYASGDFPHTLDLQSQLQKAGIPVNHPQASIAVSLYQRIYGLPRHLGQHSGGMVISQGKLDSVVPLENASMPGRRVIQWDKDDCEDMHIIKVDLLGLGMMSVMQDTIELCAERGKPVDLVSIPKDDAATYELMQKANTIGVFQIESRAQMATLPRMQPKCFYDVVVEVAIIRPGPIQGDMVHPYLARREKLEPVTYFDDRLKPTLERTLGIPLFQEQLLKMAMVMADFSGSEAEELRRALSYHRSLERMEKVCVKLREGMQRNGVAPDVIEKITQAVQSFAVYGFPESHALSFALIAYASAWMKVHRTAEFFTSLLNCQPMGFYSSATLVKDAKRHGVKVRAVSVLHSDWRCIIEGEDAIRLGLCVVNGLSREHGERIVLERRQKEFQSLADFKQRVNLDKDELRTLAKIGALNGLVQHRRDALWHIEENVSAADLFAQTSGKHSPLAMMNAVERLQADYEGTNLTTGPHPMWLIRPELDDVWCAGALRFAQNGQVVRVAGNVICRQRPGTARGFVFVSLEDESGVANAIITPRLFERHRLLISQEQFLVVEGPAQNQKGVIHIKARRIERLPFEDIAPPASHDFR
jgi:error-prone DNA polymerase